MCGNVQTKASYRFLTFSFHLHYFLIILFANQYLTDADFYGFVYFDAFYLNKTISFQFHLYGEWCVNSRSDRQV